MDEVAELAARAQAEADHRRRLGLSAASTSPASARSPTRSAPIFMVDMAHFAGLVAGGAHPSPVPARPCRHHHHAQDPARPARRHDPDQRRGARQEDQLGRLPRPAGRPADARHRRQGRGLRRGAAARVQALRAARSSRTPRRWPTALHERRLRHRLRRHRQPPDAGRPAPEGRHRQGRRGGARAAPTSPATRTAFPFDPEKPMRHLGHPPRHAGRHHARLRRRRVPGRSAS